VESKIKLARNKPHRESTYLAKARQEEALRSSQEYFRALMENSPDAVIIINEDGTIRYESPSYELLLGFKPEDRVGNNLFERIHPDDITRVAELLAEFLQNRGGTLRTEVCVKHNDGSWRFIEAIGSNLLDNPIVKGIVVNLRDITERKNAEEALRSSQEYFRALTENAYEAIAVLNHDGSTRYESLSVAHMLGYEPEDLVGRNVFELVHPEDVDSAVEAFAKLLQSPGAVIGMEARYKHKDGSWRYIEGMGKNLLNNPALAGIVVNYRDITERKMAEEALRQSEEKYRLQFENISDVIFSYDREFRILSMSPSVKRMLGYSPEELIGKRFTDLSILAPECLELALSNALRTLEGEHLGTSEYIFIAKDGSRRCGELSEASLLFADGKVLVVLSVGRDITDRKIAEQRLRESEEALQTSERQYRLLAENVKDVIWTIDMNLRLTYTSPSITQLTGYRHEEYMTKTLEEILTPASVEFVTNLFAEELALDNRGHRDLFRALTFEAELICKDGSTVAVEMKATALRDADGRPIGVLGVSRDISDRKLAEQALRQREHDYSLLLESTHESIIVFDAETLKVVFGNRRAALMFGFDPILHDAIGVGMLDHVHPEDKEVVLKGLAEDLHTSERRKRYEIRVKTKDGKELWASALATRIKFQGRLAVLLSLMDISDKKRAEEALEEYKEDYATLLENLSDAVFKFKDGVVVWCNDKVKEIYGYSKDELIGKDAAFFVPADRDPLEFIKSIYAVMKKEGCYRGSATAKTKDRGTVDIEYSISQIPNKDHIELVTVARDVTERRRLEEQIQLAGRLAAVGELAAGVAHELNNPLAAIQGFAQLLIKSNDLNEATRKDLDTVYREAKRAARITQNLLSFARKHQPEKQMISINEALEKTLELRAHHMKVNNIELSVQLQPDLPMTMADFYQVQQVFMNIIINAEQAMLEAHGKGKLVIKTKKVGDMIKISFADDGPGISEENMNKIFDPFFTTKDPGKGTGLGLSICYGIVKAHAGQIYARSKPGEGATFVVELPIVSWKSIRSL